MSDPNNTNKGMEQWVKLLPLRFRHWVDVWHALREQFRRITVLGQVIVALLGLGFALFHVFQWEKRSAELGKRIESSFGAKLDNTVWQHKGLAAYLLSDIESVPIPPSPNATPTPETKLEHSTNEIARLISEQQSNQAQPRINVGGRQGSATDITEVTGMVEELMTMPDPKAHASTRPGPASYLEGLHIINDPSDSKTAGPTSQALVAGGEKFFLFLPATALRRQTLSYEPLNDNSLRSALIHNPDIVLDLSLAARLIDEIEKLDGQKFKSQSIVQSYFITESGLILIRSSHRLNQLLFYGNYFDTNHNFTDRAYFWNAITALKEASDGKTSPVYPFGYVSEPYIDLGGHGLIKTYSKAFPLANGRYGVLCVDVTASQLRQAIEARLNVLKPDDATNTFEVKSFMIDRKGKVVAQRLPPDFEWFSDKLTSASTKQASLLGKIASEDAKTGDVHRFTIPWERTITSDGVHVIELMLVRINLNQFWSMQEWRVVYICLGLVVFLAVTFNIFQDYLLLKREISELAETVDRVMTHAINPYVRLNSKNEFVFVNDSFLELLDYKNPEDLSDEGTARTRTFRSILTPDSQREYDEILKTSDSGLPTKEYSTTLFRKSGSQKVKALVQGERIVFPAIRRKKYPHRFGIVVSANEVNDAGEDSPIQLGQRVIARNTIRAAQVAQESKSDK